MAGLPEDIIDLERCCCCWHLMYSAAFVGPTAVAAAVTAHGFTGTGH